MAGKKLSLEAERKRLGLFYRSLAIRGLKAAITAGERPNIKRIAEKCRVTTQCIYKWRREAEARGELPKKRRKPVPAGEGA